MTLVGGLHVLPLGHRTLLRRALLGPVPKDAADVTTKLQRRRRLLQADRQRHHRRGAQGQLDKERVAIGAAGLPRAAPAAGSPRQGEPDHQLLPPAGRLPARARGRDRQDAGEHGRHRRRPGPPRPARRSGCSPTSSSRPAPACCSTPDGLLTRDQVQAVVSPSPPPCRPRPHRGVGHRLQRPPAVHQRRRRRGDHEHAAPQALRGRTGRRRPDDARPAGRSRSLRRPRLADLDFDKTQHHEDGRQGTKSAVTGSDKTTETYRQRHERTASGVRSNATTGPPAVATGSTAPRQVQKKSETARPSPSDQLDESQQATGTVKRQSVAVVLDSSARTCRRTPRSSSWSPPPSASTPSGATRSS